ncbi:TVA2 protein, partial [Crocuta crocuta]
KCYNNSNILCLTMSLRIGVSGKNGVEHSPWSLTAQEGDFVVINCSYSIGMTTLHWLQQNPGGGIVSLFILSLEMKKKGRIRATINTKELHSYLYITASQPRDSAVYLCAVETQCSIVIRSL